ncbi:hypothetical protein U8V72_11460 [Priestia filamentosa]|uniref:hypothetical protein n=1 Tax=Priestia filamentosa TaxID=1402861 RepID=UPI0039781DBC
MKQEIIDSYKTAFEDLERMFKSIEDEVKNEATAEVSNFMFNNKFDESQAAVAYLQSLLAKIKVEIDFNDIEDAIKDYNSKMEMLRDNPPPMPQSTQNEGTATKQVTFTEAFKEEINKEENSQPFGEFVQKSLKNHKFNIVNVKGNDIELEKNKKHYYMTVANPNFKKEDYVEVLERMNQKKNIGFICENEANMQAAKQIADDWAKSSPDYMVKFLTINFTTKEKLKQNEGSIFEPLAY